MKNQICSCDQQTTCLNPKQEKKKRKKDQNATTDLLSKALNVQVTQTEKSLHKVKT